MIGKTLTLTSAGLAAVLLWPAAVSAGTGSWQEERAAAVAAYGSGNYGDAEARLLGAIDQAKSFGPHDPRLAATLNDLALTYFRLGRYAEAEPLHQRALEIRERTYGMDDPMVAATLNDLAFLYVAQGRTTEAGRLHGRALATGARWPSVKRPTGRRIPRSPRVSTILVGSISSWIVMPRLKSIIFGRWVSLANHSARPIPSPWPA